MQDLQRSSSNHIAAVALTSCVDGRDDGEPHLRTHSLGLLDVPGHSSVGLGWGGAHAGGSYDDQSTGYLLPTNLWVCIQLRRPDPDIAKINWVISFFVVGVQGTVQVLTIVIMAQFVTGL